MSYPSEPKLKVRAQSAPWWAAVEILLLELPLRPGDKTKAVIGVETKEVERGERIDPTLRLDMEDAQTLMDDLWQCGIRPTDGVDNPGELRATKSHLEDKKEEVLYLRKLVSGDK